MSLFDVLTIKVVVCLLANNVPDRAPSLAYCSLVCLLALLLTIKSGQEASCMTSKLKHSTILMFK